MPTNATNFTSRCTVSLLDITRASSFASPCHSTSCRCWLCFREVLIASREGVLPLTSSECSFRSKARPAARDSAFKHRVLGDKTRSRGTPLPSRHCSAAQLQTSSATISTFVVTCPSAASITGAPTASPSPSFYIDEAGEGGKFLSTSGLHSRFPPSPAPHPPKSQ